MTLERALPEDDDAARSVEQLAGHHELGVDQVVLDPGHPLSTEPVLRLVEQVVAPLRAG